jgi:DNA-binding response OmpR family regulator
MLALVAEDEPRVRQLICAALQAVGFDVLEACNGRELDAYVATHTIDVIVADYHMPVESGLAHLRAEHRATPFILITALSDDAMIVEAHRLGAAVLEKPFELRMLAAVASRVTSSAP